MQLIRSLRHERGKFCIVNTILALTNADIKYADKSRRSVGQMERKHGATKFSRAFLPGVALRNRKYNPLIVVLGLLIVVCEITIMGIQEAGFETTEAAVTVRLLAAK